MDVPEYPVAGADSWEKKLLVGVPVWKNGRLSPAALEELVQNMHLLPQAAREEWRIGLVIFGRRPFMAEVHRKAAAAGVGLVTLAEIEPLLSKAREAVRREQDGAVSEPVEF